MILVVDDETSVREFVCRVLREKGYDVLEAGTGADALRLAQDHAGDLRLLVSDEVMPGMTGTALAIELKHTHPDLRVICMSGFLRRDAVAKSGAGGEVIDRFLMKPFSIQDLVSAVTEMLGPKKS